MSEQSDIQAVEEPAATGAIKGANPFVGLTAGQVAAAAGRYGARLVRHPTVAASRAMGLTAEELRILVGASSVQLDPKDKRFADSAWNNPAWKRLAQSYLATRNTVLESVDEVDLDPKSADRARFALMQITEALAPTNNLLGNPAALKKALGTKGQSLRDGFRHFRHDLLKNGAMPSQVDTRPFRVGETIAVTPGSVVLRHEMFELLQYDPSTEEVYVRPTLVIPPQVNRYYFLDLAPGRSFVEYAVSRGLQTFMMSWRNPTPDHRDWGLDAYLNAVLAAIESVRDVTGAEDVNVIGFCAGGMTLAALLSHLASTGRSIINGASLAVTTIDAAERSTINMFASERSTRVAIARSRRKGVLDGRSLAKVFAWVRPNDLVWSYWVSNYLLGNNPPAFDILAWNADSTNLPAELHAEFLHMWVDNGLMIPGTLNALGTPVDLSTAKGDVYVLGAATDHLVPWQSAYAATQVFGGDVRFVLSNSGHIQALVNPPGNPKASYFVADDNPPSPEAWRQGAERQTGSWWVDWADWTIARSGELRSAPTEGGSHAYPVIEPAPGQYVVG